MKKKLTGGDVHKRLIHERGGGGGGEVAEESGLHRQDPRHHPQVETLHRVGYFF